MTVPVNAIKPGQIFRTGADSAPAKRPRPVVPFLFGALVGGVAGTVLGSLVAGLLGEAISGLYRTTTRRSGRRDQPPFDLLLQ